MRISIIVLLLLSLVACSSLKPPLHPAAKYDADSYLAMAREQEAVGDISAAIKSYSYASGLYSSCADIEGKLSCMAGLGRIAITEGKQKAYQDIANDMKLLVMDTNPVLDYHLLLLKLYELQTRHDYAALSETAMDKTHYPLYARLQISTIKLQADSYLGKSTDSEAKELLGHSKQYRKLLKKQNQHNPELLSAAWHALAYHYYLNEYYTNAKKYISYACDWDYLSGNYKGLGHGYWLKGQIEARQKDKTAALANLRKAEIIFEALQDSAAIQAVKGEIARVKGETP